MLRTIMKFAVRLNLLVMYYGTLFFALDEMSLELPGGATMEFIWLEPGSSLSGGRRVMMNY